MPKKKLSYAKGKSATISTSDNIVIKARSAQKVATIEEALELSGGFGRFQVCQVFICCLTMIRCGLTYYPVPYMEL